MPAAAATGRPEAKGLSRPRLLARLDEHADLTLVVAAAGFGKTTLLAQFAGTTAAATAWHRARSEDAAEACLAAGLRASLAAAGLPALAGGDQGETLLGLAQRLSESSESGSPQAILLVDDFQTLLDTPGERAFETFLRHRPATLKVAVASRRMPSFNLSCAELGSVALVVGDDLRFRSWEVEELFGDVYREPLPPTEIAALARRTEGWAAGLHLFHLSTRGRRLEERREAVNALSSRSRYARSYLARAVLDELPENLRDFLHRTCVFDVLTAERCDRLLDIDDAQTQLEDLERRLAFTTSEDEGRTFRYHDVLRRHLESALVEKIGSRGARGWYARTAALLEDEGALSEAVRAYALAGRWPDAIRLLRQGDAHVDDSGGGPAWPTLFPPKLVDEDPWLSLALARHLARDGALLTSADRYRQAERLFADPGGRESASSERRGVEVWLHAPAQPHLHWLDALREAVRRHPLEPRFEHNGVSGALGRAVALLLGGEPAAAGRLLDGLRPDGRVLELAVRLARHAATAAAGEPVDRDLVECLALDASREGVMWVDRQCRALLPWLGTPGADTLDHVAGSSVVAECDEIGDSWGALLASAADALGRLVSGRRSSPSWVEVERRAVGLDAGTVVAWAAAFGALAAARDREPGADATRAARLARAFGVPGAAAVAAVAAGSSVDRDRVPLWLGRLIRRGVRSESPSPAVDLLAGPVAGTALNTARGSTALEAAGAAPMTLQCFGGFRLLIAGREPDWSVVRPRAAATLRLLAINAGRPVHRETLLEALWPAVDAGQATRNLQVAISSLRRLLEPTVARGETAIIVRAADAYALVPPAGSEVDVVAFREGLDAARKARGLGDVAGERAALIDLVAAYGGDLLPADGPAEWLVAERERARLAAAAAAERLAELEARLGDHPAAVAAARRGLEIDQFRDATWRVLIAACDAAGDAAAARRARQEYSAVLHELGLPGRQGELVAT